MIINSLYRRDFFLYDTGRYAYSSVKPFFPVPLLYLNTEKSINDYLFSILKGKSFLLLPRVARELFLSLYHRFDFGLPLNSFDLNSFIPLSDLAGAGQLGEIKYGRGEPVG